MDFKSKWLPTLFWKLKTLFLKIHGRKKQLWHFQWVWISFPKRHESGFNHRTGAYHTHKNNVDQQNRNN